MVFVVGENIFNITNQFIETAWQSPQKEVASAASSNIMVYFFILAQAGIQHFKVSCLRRNDSIVVGVTV